MGLDEGEERHLQDLSAQLHRDQHLARRAALLKVMSPAVPSWRAIVASSVILTLTFGTFLLWARNHNTALLVATLVLFYCVMLPIATQTRRRPSK